MSRHDVLLAHAGRVKPSLSSEVIELINDLSDALREELEAHDKTRAARNEQTERALRLLGTVRGLEVKVKTLQEEVIARPNTGAASFREGYMAGLRAASEAIGNLEDNS